MPDPSAPWVVVAEYGAVLEADFAAATLQEAGIPARVTGAHLGMFGARVMVPWHREDDARRVLGIDGEGADTDDREEAG